MEKKIFLWAAIFGALSVLFGAFGAHALKDKLTQNDIEVFKTGVQYQFYHSIALFICGFFYLHYQHRSFIFAANCFSIGIILFSFSLYFLKLITLTSFGEQKWIGIITPFGGISFVVGWIKIATFFIKKNVA